MQPRVFRFQNGICRERRRNEDDGGVGAGLLDGLGDGVEDRPALVDGSALARGDPANDDSPVVCRALGVESAFLAGDALHDETSVFIDQY